MAESKAESKGVYACVEHVASIQMVESSQETYKVSCALIEFAKLCVKHGANPKFSAIKETRGFGNTSVSMGAAVVLDQPCALFLNYGSNGIKAQAYDRVNKLHFTVHKEIKPKAGTLNFHATAIDDAAALFPAVKDKPTVEDVNGDASRRVVLIREQTAALIAQFEPEYRENCFMFITGPARSAWEKDENSDALESLAHACFHDLAKPVGRGYYLPQADEGEFEALACETLHTSMGEVKPDGLMAVGGSSAQFRLGAKEWNLRVGMNKVDQFVEEFRAIMPEMLQKADGAHIALKSGFALYAPFVAQMPK